MSTDDHDARIGDGAGVTVAESRRVRAALAREDFAAFCEYVMTDEASGALVELCDMHREWADLLDRHSSLVLLAHIESAKTSLCVVARILWKLGRDPSRRMCIVSNTQGLAKKPLALVGKYLKSSARLREVFPNLVPDENAGWRADALFVQRPTLSRDPSVYACGVHGALLGARLEDVFIDDIDDFESTRTDVQRATTSAWLRSTVISRLVRGGCVVATGVTWHDEDALAQLKADGWPTFRYPVQDEDGTPRWPAHWPADAIAEKRRKLGRRASANQLDLVPLAENGRIDPAWIDAAFARGTTSDGRFIPMMSHAFALPRDSVLVVGVDLAVGLKAHHDRTAIVVLCVRPNGHREVVRVESGRWSAMQIIQRLASINERFMPRTILVESNGQQGHIIQMSRALANLPVRPFATGRGEKSMEFGFDKLAVELEGGRMTFLGKGHPETEQLARDVLAYDSRQHTPDRLSALVLARHAADDATRFVGWLNKSAAGLDLLRR